MVQEWSVRPAAIAGVRSRHLRPDPTLGSEEAIACIGDKVMGDKVAARQMAQ